MNSHAEIQRRLAAYCGGDLDPVERQQLEQHLADCPACRAEVADLQTALRLIRTTPEIEPPPWLTTRIMAHIKEKQAVKRNWWQRLFLPLQVKLPLEALALLLVCVSGYYLSRTVETDLLQTGREQLQEIPARKESRPEPSQIQPHGRNDHQEQPARTEPKRAVPLEVAPKSVQKLETAPPEPQLQLHTAPAPSAAPPPVQRDQYDRKAESMKALPTAEAFGRNKEVAPQLKAKSSRSLVQSSETAAPAAAGSASGSHLLSVKVRMIVNEPIKAPAMIREALLRSGGAFMEEQGHSLKAELPALRQIELLERLERFGRIIERPVTSSSGGQLVEIIIQW